MYPSQHSFVTFPSQMLMAGPASGPRFFGHGGDLNRDGIPDSMQVGLPAGHMWGRHYTLQGTVEPMDANGNGIPDFLEQGSMGFGAPWWGIRMLGSTTQGQGGNDQGGNNNGVDNPGRNNNGRNNNGRNNNGRNNQGDKKPEVQDDDKDLKLLCKETDRCGGTLKVHGSNGKVYEVKMGETVEVPVTLDASGYFTWSCDGTGERTRPTDSGTTLVKVTRGANRKITFECYGKVSKPRKKPCLGCC